ncbi:hypothetical protein WR25_23696 [Diploscapter pachys]|uniref:Uncharacterized protein n=1 Tax=Diploscapter pachys TaxID=2018661 RepID=A0A2A2JDW4_9BILA|nr:hypothetical protein WR25_23696 [Diploscapter pachys]
MNQPPPPIGFETPDSNDPRCKQPVVNNVEAEQMATLYAEAQMRKERNEAEYKQEVDKGQQADQKRQLTLSGIARAGQAERVTDEEKRKQERTKLDENRMKQKEEMENIKQEAEQKLMRIEANAKEARAAFEKKLEYDEANSRQRINALDQETKRLVAQQEAMNAENRRKRSEDRAARQAQHDREMAEKRKALAASREREEDYKKRIRELELEVTRTVQIMSLSINPSSPVLLPNSFLINPVPQSAIAHPAPSPENIKEIMDDIAEIDEMLRKECEKALENIPKYYKEFDNRTFSNYSENALKSVTEGAVALYDKLSELKSIAGESEPIKNVFEDVQYLKGDSKEMLNQLPNCSNLAPEKQAHPAPSLENIKEIMDDIAEIDEMLRKECERALKYISKYYENFDDRTFSNYSEYALKSIAERTVNLVDKLSELKSIIGESKPIKNVLEDVQYLKGDSKEMLNQLPNCSNLAPEKRTKLFENLKKSFEYYCQTFDEFKSSMQ